MDIYLCAGRIQRALVLIVLTLICHFGPAKTYAQVYVGQLISLLPSDAVVEEVLPGTQLSQQIEDLTLDILNTSSGQILCQALIDNPIFIRRALFINDSGVSKAANICRGKFASKFSHSFFQKRYFVIWTNQTNYLADGWTSPRNETFIFLNRQEYSQIKLAHILSHEMAMAFDGKDSIGQMGLLDWTKTGIQLDPTALEIVPIIRNALIKNAMASLRAFDMESKIIKELRMPLDEGLEKLPSMSCLEKMQFIWPYMLPLSQGTLGPESLVNSLMEKSIPNSEALDGIYRLTQLSFTFKDGHTETVCNYMTKSEPFLPGISFRGGPGPRIGDGWSMALEVSNSQKNESPDTQSVETEKAKFKQQVQRQIQIKIKPSQAEDKTSNAVQIKGKQ